MSLKTNHESLAHPNVSGFAAIGMSWLIAILCVISAQTAVAQNSINWPSQELDNSSSVRMTANDLENFAVLPTPAANVPDSTCPANCTGARCSQSGCHTNPLVEALEKLDLDDAAYVDNYALPKEAFPPATLFCQQMTDMLAGNLKNIDHDDPEFKKSIQTAMAMVVQNTNFEHQQKMAQLRTIHQGDINYLQGQMVQLSSQSNVTKHLNDWLSTLYASQNRNHQQLQILSSSTNNLNRKLAALEQHLGSQNYDNANRNATMLAPKKISNPNVVRQASTVEPSYDQDEIRYLQQQLRQIEKRMQEIRNTNPVQPATHLQPIRNSNNSDNNSKNQTLPLPAAFSTPRGNYRFNR